MMILIVQNQTIMIIESINLRINMKIRNTVSNSVHYEKMVCVVPDGWSVGKLVDWVILCKLENGEAVLSIELEENE